MDKKELRKFAKTLRENIENREFKSNKISDKLKNLDVYKNAETVFVFISFGDEVSTKLIIQNCISDNKIVLVPKIVDAEMIPVRFDNFDLLKENKHGILEPISSEKYKGAIDLTITPGLLFDKSGYRLGYGGGYYDRFFASTSTIKIGVAFSEQLVDTLPHDDYDIALDFVLSD